MRRMLFLVTSVGLLSTVLGCHCYHGVCDCDLVPPGIGGGPGPAAGPGHGANYGPGPYQVMPKAGVRLTPVPDGTAVVTNG